MKQIRWGIMGTGWIAERFCTALSAIGAQGAVIYAIGSRRQDTADAFAAHYGAAKAYNSYEKLVADPDVDVIYIATPHRFHHENALLCIEHGKPILCEKAFTVNAKQAQDIADKAKEKGVFVMEAFWPRFQPLNVALKKAICEERIIGDIRMMQTDFVKVEEWPDDHRIYNPHLAGGTMLDLGIYTMSYTTYFLGRDVADIHAVATIGKGGVDDQCAMLVKFQNGAIAVQCAALQTEGRKEAVFFGTKGQIRVPDFFCAAYYDRTDYETGETRRIESEPFIRNGYEYEALEVMDCLRAGKLESDTMPLSESVQLMQLLDACRKEYGFIYPFE